MRRGPLAAGGEPGVTALRLLEALRERGGSAVATKRGLGEAAGLCQRSADRAVRACRAAGLLEVDCRFAPNGASLANRYTLTAAGEDALERARAIRWDEASGTWARAYRGRLRCTR